MKPTQTFTVRSVNKLFFSNPFLSLLELHPLMQQTIISEFIVPIILVL